MHPAYSVILFTTSSGAGYGLLFWLSLAHLTGAQAHDTWGFFFSLALALVLVTVGLLASTLHLGHPERAWRAFSQWRSSWLSREGVAAVATYVPAGLLALASLFGIGHGLSEWLALLSLIGAALTVHCTGMIYASLRTIRQWNLALVPVVYQSLAAASGAILFAALMALSGRSSAWHAVLALAALAVAFAAKWLYFQYIDGDLGKYTAAMALGMGDKGIRQIDPPHTRPNFVMREMGYAVARRHAARLRLWALGLLFALPALCLLIVAIAGASALLYCVAILSAAAGLAVERWLFFAEATHVSQLYYGKDRA